MVKLEMVSNLYFLSVQELLQTVIINKQRHLKSAIQYYTIQIMIKNYQRSKNLKKLEENLPSINYQQINKTLNHKKKVDSIVTSFSSMANYADKVKKKISLNDEILNRRKENFLNTQYNKRLGMLKQITRQNKSIYKRINSQKSLYSQDELKKSSVSIRSLSRSNSRVSQKSFESKKNTKQYPAKQRNNVVMTIQPSSVSNVKTDQVKQFQSVFMLQGRSKIGPLQSNKRRNQSFSLRNQKIYGKNIQVERKDKVKPLNLEFEQDNGNILHNIAEQIYQKPQKKQPNSYNSYSRKRFLY